MPEGDCNAVHVTCGIPYSSGIVICSTVDWNNFISSGIPSLCAIIPNPSESLCVDLNSRMIIGYGAYGCGGYCPSGINKVSITSVCKYSNKITVEVSLFHDYHWNVNQMCTDGIGTTGGGDAVSFMKSSLPVQFNTTHVYAH